VPKERDSTSGDLAWLVEEHPERRLGIHGVVLASKI
jgi:hypothetical protein